MTGVWLALGVALAGGIGAALRHLVDQLVPKGTRHAFPWGLFVVNLTGSFVLGILTGLALDDAVQAVLATGLLGGYTTFSSASLDTAKLLMARRFTAAVANAAGVMVAAIACAVAGILLGQSL
ncbi:CrcB protein [Leucobacter exalbidus]|uniref:Fluoride-specific ion channel FluC n=1 Tax=Leucobacter exalbidus TaxID=662960 RepID=A0A940SZZ5_9MICO|nr:CrcB family protein [Leucobacter exalbidus]MBP1325395.1 CrcB protein [Leucobacter exalbidus]